MLLQSLLCKYLKTNRSVALGLELRVRVGPDQVRYLPPMFQ